MYLAKPHIGTDNLITIVENMRNYIISKGGTFMFNEKVTDFDIDENTNKIRAVICSKKILTDTVILAIGHSSKDTFELLYKKKINMEAKNFSVGVRIEHRQKDMDNAQYGKITKLRLPPSEYKLSYNSPNTRTFMLFFLYVSSVEL